MIFVGEGSYNDVLPSFLPHTQQYTVTGVTSQIERRLYFCVIDLEDELIKNKNMKKKVSFESLIESEVPTLVDFSAEWCGPCKAMAPILKEVAGNVKDKAKIVKIDVDRNRELSTKLKIMGVPTFILYKGGKQIWRESGMQSAKKLEQVIDNAK